MDNIAQEKSVPQIATAKIADNIAQEKSVPHIARAKIVVTFVWVMEMMEHWKTVLKIVLIPIAALVPSVQMRIVRSMF